MSFEILTNSHVPSTSEKIYKSEDSLRNLWGSIKLVVEVSEVAADFLVWKKNIQFQKKIQTSNSRRSTRF